MKIKTGYFPGEKMSTKKISIDKDVFRPQECQFIKETILGDDFPWYYNHDSTKDDGVFYLSHQLVQRPEQRPESPTNAFNTRRFYHAGLTEAWLKISKRFIKKHKIPFKEFLRASLNMTLPQKISQCPEHRDHPFPYYQLIFYLNTVDGDTVLLNKKKEHSRLTPEAFKAVGFGHYYSHYVIHPTKGRRVIMVVTFH